ncbi:putative NADH:ubiquinone reductase (non-electrogenic) [Helianthus annuus]|nr:putative NADH:ubiquinone reductase (non-electrogenic) [Helianthus annuus]
MDSRVTSPHFPIYSAPLLSSRSSSIINGAILSSVQDLTLSSSLLQKTLAPYLNRHVSLCIPGISFIPHQFMTSPFHYLIQHRLFIIIFTVSSRTTVLALGTSLRVISTCLWGTFNQFKGKSSSVSEEEKKRILHFVVVGGGPTGVEFAAELHDFLHEDLVKLYPDLEEYTTITLLEAGDHILSMFDKRITDFAEEKFKRDGINLKTGSMVVKVSDKSISLKERSTGEMKDVPYGIVVRSTGIGTRPVVMDFMKQIGQGNRRVMATDEWLRVEGVTNVYALGDCATINQRKVMEDISAIFSKADKNKSGKLNVGGFAEVTNDIIERYPQVELHLKSKKLKNFVELLQSNQDDAAKKATQLDIEKFKKALSEVDTKMKSLPPTAQVAAQQGEYLAKCFSRMKECEENHEGPIRFRDSGRHHFKPFSIWGQFAPLGGEQTAAQLPGDWVSMGHSAQWLCL